MVSLTFFFKFRGRGYCWCKNPPDHKNLSTPPCEPLCSIQYGGVSMQRHWYQWCYQEKIRSLNLIFDAASTEIPLMRWVSSMISRQCQQHLSQWNTTITLLLYVLSVPMAVEMGGCDTALLHGWGSCFILPQIYEIYHVYIQSVAILCISLILEP